MDELLKLITEKTGVSEAIAKTAVELVVDYIKKKAPGQIGPHIDRVLKGGGLGEIAKGLLGKLGKK